MIIDKGHKMALSTKSGEIVQLRLEINPKARRLILRLDERQREAVAVAPNKRALAEAVEFAKSRIDWMQTQLEALPKPLHLAAGEQFQLRGAPCFLSAEGTTRRAQLAPGPPQTLHLPGDLSTLGQRALRYLRKAAREDLTLAVETYCRQLNVAVRRVSIKDTRSRWGSCTSTGNLAFSWRLIMAPREVLDYVAAHECAHLLEMNHSSAFWAHVATCRPNWKQERRWLRQNGPSLHAVQVAPAKPI